MIKQYRKKPVVIEAVQWTGDNTDEIKNFIGNNFCYATINNIIIKTLEGEIEASKDDYIIKGVHGEFYPCKPDIFMITYDEVYL